MVLCVLSASVYAQKSDTLITYNFGDNSTKAIARATETYKVYKKDSTWIRTMRNAKNALIKIETFSDEKLKVLNGSFIAYEDGHVSIKGFYRDNKKTGKWARYDVDGQLKETKEFDQDELNGTYITYWKNGNVKISWNFIDGQRVGEWKILYENGNLALKESYSTKSKLIDSTYLDIEGKPVKRVDIMTEPSFPGGLKKFYRYLAKNTRYPVDAQELRIQGKVYLSFWVSKTGALADIKAIASPSASISAEAIRVMQQSPYWIPATLFGNPTDVCYNIDINFTLS